MRLNRSGKCRLHAPYYFQGLRRNFFTRNARARNFERFQNATKLSFRKITEIQPDVVINHCKFGISCKPFQITA